MNVAFPALVLLVLLIMLIKRAWLGPQQLFARVSLAQLAVGVGGVFHRLPDWESVGMLTVDNTWLFKRHLRQGKGQ